MVLGKVLDVPEIHIHNDDAWGDTIGHLLLKSAVLLTFRSNTNFDVTNEHFLLGRLTTLYACITDTLILIHGPS